MIERITELTDELLAELLPMGDEFCKEAGMQFPFNGQFFSALWRDLLKAGIGTLFVARQNDKVIGAIGLLITPDPFSGVAVGVESFWFVAKAYRGGISGIKLLSFAIDWAEELHLAKLVMAHLHCSVSEKAASVYTRFGFKLQESNYVKTWQ